METTRQCEHVLGVQSMAMRLRLFSGCNTIAIRDGVVGLDVYVWRFVVSS